MRSDAHMSDSRVGRAVSTVWVLLEVLGLTARKIIAGQDVGRPLTLHGELVVPSDDHGDVGPGLDIAALPR